MSRDASRARAGFTLLEVVVALVVTGLVVSLAYGVARAGFDADDRLARVRDEGASIGAARALLMDAVRHVDRGVAATDTVFALAVRDDALGRPHDALRLATRGVVPPLGTGGRWVVALEADGDGVALVALPVDARAGRSPLRVRVPQAAGVRVRTLARTGDAWRRGWPRVDAAPLAVEVALTDSAGRVVGAPLVARTAPEGAAEEQP